MQGVMYAQHASPQTHGQQGVRQPQAWPSKPSGGVGARASTQPGTPSVSYVAPPGNSQSLSYVPPPESTPQVSMGHQARQATGSPPPQGIHTSRSVSRLHLQEGMDRSVPPMHASAANLPHTPVADHREAFRTGPPRSCSEDRHHQGPAAGHSERAGCVEQRPVCVYAGVHPGHAETERQLMHSHSRAQNVRSPPQRSRHGDSRGAPASSPKGALHSGPPSYTPPPAGPPAWSLPAPMAETTPRKPSYVPPPVDGVMHQHSHTGPSRSPDPGSRSQVSRRPSHGMKTRSPARRSHDADPHSMYARPHAFEGQHGQSATAPSGRSSPRQDGEVGRQGSAPGCYTERLRSPAAGDGGRQHSSVMSNHGDRQQKLESNDRNNMRAPRASHYERKLAEMSEQLQDYKSKIQDLEFQLAERDADLGALREAKHHDAEALREAERKERHRASEKRNAREKQERLEQREKELEEFEAKLFQQKQEEEAALQIRENQLNIRETELMAQLEARRLAQQESLQDEANQVRRFDMEVRQRERELATQQAALMDSRNAALADREAAQANREAIQAKTEAIQKKTEEMQLQRQELQTLRFELEDRDAGLNKREEVLAQEEDRLRTLRKQLEERERQHIEACREAQVLRQHPTSSRRLSPHSVGKENQNIRKQLEEQQDRMHEIKQMGWKQEKPQHEGNEESTVLSGSC
mmetsp:Transcript_146508/g.255576  ORF Transcript_146508/g.255576 Transcript_146508/m.255576 type:complete len:695 (-) Transcript_146508:212-2296(-)